MVEQLTPRPAATVMTLRDGIDGCEILMLRRNLKSDFVGGAYVFPGGGVEDGDVNWPGHVYGLNDEAASSRLGLSGGGLAFYVASLRELFEEAGLLIACDERGVAVHLSDADDVTTMSRYRREINAGRLDFFSMMEETGLRLDLRDVQYVAHWITPVGPPRRYDTRFFVVPAPEGQVATHDAGETVADHWLRPRDALDAHERGEFEMILPTIRNLEAIAHFSSSREVLAYAHALTSVPCVEPQIVQRDGMLVILTPGDEGFRPKGA